MKFSKAIQSMNKLADFRRIILSTNLCLFRCLKNPQAVVSGYFDKNRVREEYIGYIVGDRIEFIQYNLKKQIAKALKGCEKCNDLSYDEVMESQKSWFMSSFQRFRQSVIILQQMLLRPLTAILPHTVRMKSFFAIPDFLQSRFTEWRMNCGNLKSR